MSRADYYGKQNLSGGGGGGGGGGGVRFQLIKMAQDVRHTLKNKEFRYLPRSGNSEYRSRFTCMCGQQGAVAFLVA